MSIYPSRRYKPEHRNVSISFTEIYENYWTMSSIPPPHGGGGNKTEGSITIMSTLFALEFWSNKIIDVDIILSITLTVT